MPGKYEMSVTTIRRAASGVYYVHWTEGRRSKRESLGTKDPDEAERRRARRTLIAEEIEQEVVLGAGALQKVETFWQAYDERHVQKDTASPASAGYSWKNLEPHFGSLVVSQITQQKIDEYETKRTAGKIGKKSKPSTVRRELAILRACLNWCAAPKRKLLDPGLIPQFDLPAEGQPRDRWLKQSEIQRLLTAAASFRSDDGRLTRIELFLWLAIETGARKGALLELTWDRVDLETRVIHLNVPGRKQTKKRRADVPISKALMPILQRGFEERTSDLVLGHGGEVWAAVQRVACEAGFGPKSARKHEKEGVQKYLKRRATGVSPHVLRHTAATNMARRGVPLWIVAKVLGNSIDMVERVYAKHAPDDLRSAVDMITGGDETGAPQ